MTPLDRAWRGGRNDWRLHFLSIFSVAVAFVCLAAALLVVFNVQGIRARWASSGRASVYLDPGVTEEQVRTVERALRATAGVTTVRFVSSADARRELLADRVDDVLAALPPEAFPASLEVGLEGDDATARLDMVAKQLSALPMVDRVETYGTWSQRLGALLAGGVTAAAILAIIVLAAVVSVVSSTIRLVLQRRHIEVEVLKLVGATDAFVRRPFVIEGAAQGAIGAAVAVAVLGFLYAIVRSQFDGQLGAMLGMTPTFLPILAQAGMVVLGALLGAGAAFLSLRRLLSI
ncbi:MAG: FtsX-like permease family protein [Polyangiaceae bacterium]|nr:FtsX-like permease family protein [Polyangiaceae bacterium]